MSKCKRQKSRLNQRFKFEEQDYEKLRKHHLENETLFTDKKFVANSEVLTDDAEEQTIVIHYMGRKHVRRSEIEWLRPKVR